MNKQEIFTKVKNHLLTQMEKSAFVDGSCAYRGQNGLMCAVGCLIPDELYDPEMELIIYDQLLIERFPRVAALFDTDAYTLLRRLQRIHDNAAVNDWKARLQDLSIKENLEF